MKSNASHLTLYTILLLLLPFLNPTISITEAQTNDERGLRVSEGAVNAWPRKAKRFAMVIGVDEYQDTQIRGQILRATLDNAVASSHFLTDPERADAMGLPRSVADRSGA